MSSFSVEYAIPHLQIFQSLYVSMTFDDSETQSVFPSYIRKINKRRRFGSRALQDYHGWECLPGSASVDLWVRVGAVR